MSGQYLLVSFNWKSKIKIRSIEPTLDQYANDWIRYAANNWIVWTNDGSSVWYQRLVPLLEGNDTLLVCRLDTSDMAGFMPTWIWPWLTEPRSGIH